MSSIGSRVRAVLGYRTLPTTAFLLLIYLIAFFAIFATDELTPVPHKGSKKLQWLDLERAQKDLEHIAARPHPYNSHANDAVRTYILKRLEDTADGRDFVHVSNDLTSNGSWASTAYGVYFEGTNLLVKIDGTEDDDEKGAVLFSAHYDSVSTAPGATDDGMGVTTLLQLVEYFASNRMKRTAIFNINNGEEDWLNGAHAFWQHPWSNVTTTFVNLEGAAAGGRPMLFRSTSLEPIQGYYTAPHALRVRHPHGNVLSSDAFARGVIRSGTDYSVYTGIDRHGPDFKPSSDVKMQGLDIAFYKGRSRYHTKWDSSADTEGGERSLWAMIEVARGVGIGLLSNEPDNKPTRAGVYFDLFKTTMISFRLRSLLTFNVVALVAGPIILVLLWLMAAVIGQSDHDDETPPPLPPKRTAAHSPPAGEGTSAGRPAPRTFGSADDARGNSNSIWSKVKSILTIIWQQSSFWIALVLTVVVQGLYVWGYVALNPFTVYTHPYLVLLSAFSLAYLTVVLTLKLAFPSSPIKHATITRERQKTTLLLHVHLLAWILLLVSTIFIAKTKIGGTYFVTVWYIGVWGAGIVGVVQNFVISRQSSSSSSKGKNRARSDSDAEDTSERTPLLHEQTNGSAPSNRKEQDNDEGGEIGWWIVQVLLSVPAFLVLVGQVAMLLLDSMSQTLTDGGSISIVYIAISALAVFLVLPIAPFSPKLHQGLTFLSLATVIITTVYLWLVFPFTHDDPFKVFFQQQVKLDPNTVFLNSASTNVVHAPPKVTTLLTGSPVYIKSVLPYLPSSRGKDINCTQDLVRPGLKTCEWESGPRLAPIPGGKDPWGWWPGLDNDNNSNVTTPSAPAVDSGASWFKADVSRTSWASAKFSIQGRNTRNCRIYFDSPSDSGVKVIRYMVEGASKGMQPGYPIDQKTGLKELRLWSRDWEKKWVVDVDWEPTKLGDTDEDDGKLSGRIACEWVEYESAMIDNGSIQEDRRPKIPALEEVLTFLPEWAVVTKAADGLVEAWAPFSV
ncbi:hypothetical protein EST38_g2170 [Candolleomyces aberdarensis]|uniref:Peptide hydrolase n=1 Tax=Candolleomyces aberdarensis TaxID=2316362 RepID=A0A4V1Q4Y4_9AGAR|nr:hypothetical protein EST38_g2170 [Candolleomyces aberdarensis]